MFISKKFLPILSGVFALSSVLASTSSYAFTPVEKQQIIEIVRRALKEDPSILTGAIASIQARNAKIVEDEKGAILKKEWKALSDAPQFTVRGNPNGRLTVIEFLDPRCGYCRRMLPPIKAWLAREKSVRFVERIVPILGDSSLVGAKAILAAGKLGKYNEMRDLCFQSSTLTEATVTQLAGKLGLNKAAFTAAMESKEVRQIIEKNLELARSLRLDGTPCFIFGQTLLLPGALSGEQLDHYTKVALKSRN